MSDWYLYIIRCSDNSLYTGITVDVDRRFNEHCAGGPNGAKYFHAKKPVAVVLRSKMGDRSFALRAEALVKKLTKEQKERLVKGEISLEQFTITL